MPCTCVCHSSKEVAKARRAVNHALSDRINSGNRYYASLPIAEVGDLLDANNFDSDDLRSRIFLGNEGREIIEVGQKTFITVTWYRVSERSFEFVSYLHA